MTSNDEFRDLLRSGELFVVNTRNKAETSNEIYDKCFEIKDDNFCAWTNYILNVDIYYYLGEITFEIVFENDEGIICTLDEICSQSKMREKIEDEFWVTLPMLTPDEYEMFVFTIICRAFRE